MEYDKRMRKAANRQVTSSCLGQLSDMSGNYAAYVMSLFLYSR